jgi:hypothetical protein
LVRVTVTGTLPTFTPVRLVPDPQAGKGIELTPDGLGAHFTLSEKMGVRANQGLLKGFQYFEFHRELSPMNMGGGVVIQRGNLDPYDPRDVPPSCSLNTLGSTWHSLTYSEGQFSSAKALTQSYYGFAVDYRGSFPVVYIIVGDMVVDTIALPEVTVPVYPMIYGNPTTGNSPGAPDETINFGATPFRYDARAILSAAAVDVTGFVAGWGP